MTSPTRFAYSARHSWSPPGFPLGWRARVGLREGVEKTYAAFLAEQAAGTLRT